MQPWGYIVILLVMTIIFIILAAKTSLLKDAVPDRDIFIANAKAANIVNPKAPFSLSRSQLAFWTIIITSSFLYSLFRHGFEVPALNDVNLILLGISAVTTATGKIFDSAQKQNLNSGQNFPPQNFITDILSDDNGISIHRLQNVIWTLIVGMIYTWYVYHIQDLPDDSEITKNMLILMGISSGTYLGLKTTEKGDKQNQTTKDNEQN